MHPSPTLPRPPRSRQVTKDAFTNASRLVVLKPTGDVLLKETWERCVKPDGAYGGVAVGEEDVLELQRGGTGFAAHDKDLQARGAGLPGVFEGVLRGMGFGGLRAGAKGAARQGRAQAAMGGREGQPCRRRRAQDADVRHAAPHVPIQHRPRSASCWGPAAAWRICAASTRGPARGLACDSPTE